MKKKNLLIILLIMICSVINVLAELNPDQIELIIENMTPEEKLKQLHAFTWMSTEGVTLSNPGSSPISYIPGFQMSDGPHGVRYGCDGTEFATSWPVGIGMAATWNTDLIRNVGEAAGWEFRAYGKNVSLGPCMDINRDPRNGRSPESGGEDPFLNAMISSAYMNGIQDADVVATIKHFALVNRQNQRDNSKVLIDERSLMEYYGRPFRNAINEGALAVMVAYNWINIIERNSDYLECSENSYFLTDILRNKMGFNYLTMSDWDEVTDAVAAINAGTDVEMRVDPALLLYPNMNLNDVNDLDEAVRRVLRTKNAIGLLDGTQKPIPNQPNGMPQDIDYMLANNRALCLEAGEESLVLLKNEPLWEGGPKVLPFSDENVHKIAVIGPHADHPQFDGFGSSEVTPHPDYRPSLYFMLEHAWANTINEVRYVKGCNVNDNDNSNFAEALEAAQWADRVIFVGGLDEYQEGEWWGDDLNRGGDRKGASVDLPAIQQQLITYLNNNTTTPIVTVLISGGVCTLSPATTLKYVDGLIYAFYPGQEQAVAIYNTVFGMNNPSGKLPTTISSDIFMPPPRYVEVPKNFHNPAQDDYVDMRGDVIDAFGYRYYDQFWFKPEFMFGYGLSYTTFEYSNAQIEIDYPGDADYSGAHPRVKVSFRVTNTGNRAGKEVAQLYLAYPDDSPVAMPPKQLKGFFKTDELNANGGYQDITITLGFDDLAYWDINADDPDNPGTPGNWALIDGLYQVRIGGGSADEAIQLKENFYLGYQRTALNPGDIISLQSAYDLNYVCSGNSGGIYGKQFMHANSDMALSWEKFMVVDAGNGKIALAGFANDTKFNAFVSSENGAPMTCNRLVDNPDLWETFFYTQYDDGTISLAGYYEPSGSDWAYINSRLMMVGPGNEYIKFFVKKYNHVPEGQIMGLKNRFTEGYVCSENGNPAWYIIADRPSLQEWEMFRADDAGNGRITLKGYAEDHFFYKFWNKNLEDDYFTLTQSVMSEENAFEWILNNTLGTIKFKNGNNFLDVNTDIYSIQYKQVAMWPLYNDKYAEEPGNRDDLGIEDSNRFEIKVLPPQTNARISLKVAGTDKLVCSENYNGEGGIDHMTATRHRLDLWEKFSVEWISGNTIVLKGVAEWNPSIPKDQITYRYVSSEGGTGPMTCRDNNYNNEHMFNWIYNIDDNTISLQNIGNNCFVRVDASGNMYCDAYTNESQGTRFEYILDYNVVAPSQNIIVTYKIRNQWNNGASIDLIITNDSDSDINGWKLEFDFPSGQNMSAYPWNANGTQTGAHVVLENMFHNGQILRGESLDNVGFNLSYNGTNGIPVNMTLNGVQVQIVPVFP